MELENNEEGNGKGNKKRIAIIAVVVAAIIAVVVAAFLLLSPHEPEASSIKDAAPTQINMIVQADGTMTGPSAAATQIKNGSAFGIHVSKIQTTAKNSFALESTAKANDSASVTSMDGMFYGCSRLNVDCSNWDVGSQKYSSSFNYGAPGVVLPLAWQTSSDEGDKDSTIAPLCEEQENRDALSVSDENSNDEAVSKTDGEASADSEAGSSNTASADDAGAKEEASDDIVQEELAAA